jgi:hypothetical protein
MKSDVGGIKYYIPTRPFAENSDRSPTDLSYLDGCMDAIPPWHYFIVSRICVSS